MKRPPTKRIIEIIDNTGGLLRPAAQKLNCSRQTLYAWIEDDPELKAALAEVREGMLDFTEGMLFTLIKEGSFQAIQFYLKTMGKARGYVEKSEHEVSAGYGISGIRVILPPDPDEPKGIPVTWEESPTMESYRQKVGLNH